MSRVKRLGMAAAMMLVAMSAMASNFRAADQVYVPAAGKLTGSSGIFLSDVFISNLSNDAVDVSVVYAPLGANPTVQEFKNAFRLSGKERREFIDFFDSVLHLPSGFGQLIFNACLAGADCSAASQDQNGFSVNFRDIAVQTRIYSIPPGSTLAQNPATTGQLFSGIPWYNFVSSLQSNNGLHEVFITGLRATGTNGQAGTYRSNIGLVNASQFSTTTISVRLFNGAGTPIGNEHTVTLGPLGNTQVNIGTSAFAGVTGPTATNMYVVVSQRNSTPTADAPQTCLPDGCPAFFAYGSVLDNQTGDATTMEAMYTKALDASLIAQIYPTGAGKAPQRRSARH